MADPGEEPGSSHQTVGDTKSLKKRKRLSKEQKAKNARIKRGPGVDVKSISDRKLKGRLSHAEKIYIASQQRAIKANEWLLPEEAGYLEAEGMEETYKFKQQDILEHVGTGAAAKVFDLSLPELGPYKVSFTRSGRYMLLGGAKGHLAMLDWQTKHLVCEVQVRETMRAVTFLQSELFFAAAQRKYVYIYDKRGIEVHCLREHTAIHQLQFLPHHYLLASIGDTGVLSYQDTSHGAIIAQHKTRLGPCHVMTQNPYNAVLCCGHAAGTVTMWTPNITSPVVRMLTHRGPVLSLAVDPTGMYMVTTGADKQVKVWDVRMLKEMHAYFAFAPITSSDISQRGLLALSWGARTQVWRDALSSKAQSPYLDQRLQLGAHPAVADLAFCPYEDVLALGHTTGISTMLVPGAGEPNFDSFVANPYAARRERQEAEVASLLEKLQPETIVLDPGSLGGLLREPLEVQQEKQRLAEEANRAQLHKQRQKNEDKTKMKGKNKASRRHRKKQSNIIDERKDKARQEAAAQKKQRDKQHKDAAAAAEQQHIPADVPKSLHRFFK